MARRVSCAVAGTVLVAVATACTGAPEVVADDGTPSPSGECTMPSVSAEGVIEPDATGGTVAGLLFGELPARAGGTLKIVWRVTGSGDLEVTARRPDGSAAALDFGPEPHPDSNFQRPGDEWGTGFAFDRPGCWRIEVRRGDLHAEVPVEVVG